MSEKTIKQYIRSSILDFRKKYKQQGESQEDLDILRLRNTLIPTSPCQIIALKFNAASVFLILHDKLTEDLKTQVFDYSNEYEFDYNLEVLSNDLVKNYKFDFVEFKDLRQEILRIYNFRVNIANIIFATTEKIGLLGISNSLLASNKLFSNELISFMEIGKASLESEQKIKKAVVKIKQEAEEIQKSEVRDSIIAETSKLEKEMSELKKRLSEEITTVRKIIGNSVEFQDFRAFTSDLVYLKESHVPKEVFEARIGELNGKIEALDKVREAYNGILSQQGEFMKQQADVMSKQADFMKWVKYATILLPIAVILVPIIDLIRSLL